jgi:predicted metal-dependent phosphoesterase TrpH
MIDLHLHTTASDGRLAPDEVVRRAVGVGIDVLAVTDHDTMDGVAAATREAERLGATIVPGIEITSVLDGRDVHVLAYYIDGCHPALIGLLNEQRQERVERAREIGENLARLGVPIDIDELIGSRPGTERRSIARPQIAAALVAAGHAVSVADAFAKWLHDGGPACVPHRGRTPADVVSVIASAGGAASMAHPGTTRRDDIISTLVESGLMALEAYHSDHSADEQTRYAEMARRLGLAVTGGSDYHGDDRRRSSFFGVVGLPPHDFTEFRARIFGE